MSYDYDSIVNRIEHSRRVAYRRRSASSIQAKSQAHHVFFRVAKAPDDDDPSHRRQGPSDDSFSFSVEVRNVPSLHEAVRDFGTLAEHCPLAPTLWLQYAFDAGALSAVSSSNKDADVDADADAVRLAVLEAGVAEFPGSLLLRRWHCEAARRVLLGPREGHENDDVNDDVNDDDRKEEESNVVRMAYREALDWVEYRYEKENDDDDDLTALWRGYLELLDGDDDGWNDTMVRRSRVPYRTFNESLDDEVRSLWSARTKRKKRPIVDDDGGRNDTDLTALSSLLGRVEVGRRTASSMGGILGPLEDEVKEAMVKERISWEDDDDDDVVGRLRRRLVPWLVTPSKPTATATCRVGMGLGGVLTADAFLRYARGLSSFFSQRKETNESDDDDENDVHDNDDNDDTLRHLYERAVAECPTAERLWLAYIDHQTTRDHVDDYDYEDDVTLCRRAVRNCPYSVDLWKCRIHSTAAHSNQIVNTTNDNDGDSDNDNDNDKGNHDFLKAQLDVVDEAIRLKFLPPEGVLDVHLEMTRTMRRRLSNLSSAYEVEWEFHLDELREAYDVADEWAKSQPDANSLQRRIRRILWSERAAVEAWVVAPILRSGPPLREDDEEEEDDDDPHQRSQQRRRRSSRGNEWQALWEKGGRGLRPERKAVSCYETLVRIDPRSVTSWMDYIDFVRSLRNVGDCDAVTKQDPRRAQPHHPPLPWTTPQEHEKWVRSLYVRAVRAIGVEEDDPSILDQTFLRFERTHGTPSDLQKARTIVQNQQLQRDRQRHKLQRQRSQTPLSTNGNGHEAGIDNNDAAAAGAAAGDIGKMTTATSNDSAEHDVAGTDHTHMDDASTSNLSTTNDDATTTANDAAKAKPKRTNLKKTKPSVHSEETNHSQEEEYTVRVGNMTYPAHPYTIHLSNLCPEKTEDMDLVDLFTRNEEGLGLAHDVGKVVHARILRHRDGEKRGTSRGAGLVQFEERRSVEAALALAGRRHDDDDGLFLHGRRVTVTRSHCPAVSLVPPGKHRVRDKGEGTKSAYNLKRKQQRKRVWGGNRDDGHGTTHRAVAPLPDEADADVDAPATATTVATTEPKAHRDGAGGAGAGGGTVSDGAILAFRPRGITAKKRKR